MTKAQSFKYYPVGHITFRTRQCPRAGVTFAILAGDPKSPQYDKALFSGFVEKGMASELRRLAHHLDDLEVNLRVSENG